MPWRIVTDSDAQEVFRYPTTFPEQFTDQYPLDTYTHLFVENEQDPNSVKPSKSDDGSVTLVPNLEWHWGQLRARRNALLQASDWTALSDAHLSQAKKDAWFAYRQELRDLPDSVTDPTQVEWPTLVLEAPVTGSRVDNLLSQV